MAIPLKNIGIGAGSTSLAGSVFFDGISQYIDNFTFLGGNFMKQRAGKTTSFTGWLKVISNPGLVSYAVLSRNVQFRGFVLEVDGTTDTSMTLRLRLERDVINLWWLTSNQGAVPINEWFHFAAVYPLDSAPESEVLLYINGVDEKASLTNTLGGTGIAQAKPFSLGSTYNGSAVRFDFFEGFIGEMLIFNYPLRANQIRRLYNNGRPIDPNGRFNGIMAGKRGNGQGPGPYYSLNNLGGGIPSGGGIIKNEGERDWDGELGYMVPVNFTQPDDFRNQDQPGTTP